ncbi:MAG: nitroreductase [Chitinophagaceae bacterium]|nr:nitroreductase [Chitinophagaceae bacterium]
MSDNSKTALLSQVIRERRSVKPASLEPGGIIPDEIILHALENATWAPNHGKTEPWYFIVYTGEGIRHLSEFQAQLYKQQGGEKFTEAKYTNLKANYLRASHVIAICMKRDPSGKIPEVEEVAAVATAVQNFALTLHAAGYGGYWTTGGVTYYESAKPFFGLGASDKLMGFYLCGVPVAQPPAPPRKPVEVKSAWVR